MKSVINLEKLDGILWDMDGVLVDVSQSYRECIVKSVNLLLPKTKKVTTSDVSEIKRQVGLNNDWDTSYALYLQSTSKEFSIEKFIIDIPKYRQLKKYQELKTIFQAYYLGNELFNDTYGTTSPIDNPQGAITNEKLFISCTNLSKLKNKYKQMGIVTGRPKSEAQYTLQKNNIDKYFDTLVALEDTKMGKPDPEPIKKVMEILGLKNTVYIGDSSSDIVASANAGISSIYIGDDNLGDINFESIKYLLDFLL